MTIVLALIPGALIVSVGALCIRSGMRRDARLARARELAALAQPWLSGIPLPHTDDPRWHLSKPLNCARFGVPVNGDYHFEVARTGRCFFQGDYLGSWEAYAAAVFAPLDAAEHDRRVAKALKAMDADS